jgi:hypothetical protein
MHKPSPLRLRLPRQVVRADSDDKQEGGASPRPPR